MEGCSVVPHPMGLAAHHCHRQALPGATALRSPMIPRGWLQSGGTPRFQRSLGEPLQVTCGFKPPHVLIGTLGHLPHGPCKF